MSFDESAKLHVVSHFPGPAYLGILVDLVGIEPTNSPAALKDLGT
jgi:hypothetical protein